MEKKNDSPLNGKNISDYDRLNTGTGNNRIIRLPGVDRSKVISSSPMIIRENSSKKK